MDFNIWLGPAPEQPYHENLVHYNWHWFWDTGCGEIGNQGVHQMDIARWAIGDRLPKSVIAMGGRWVDGPDFEDQGQTPNMQLTVMDFGGPLLVFEVRGLVEKKGKKGEFPSQVTNEFYLEAGAIKGGKFYPKGKTQGEPLVQTKAKKKRGGSHFANFIQAVRSRKQEELNADILGISPPLAATWATSRTVWARRLHSARNTRLWAIASRSRKNVKIIEKNLQAPRWIWILRSPRIPWRTELQFDPKAEKFIGNAQADALLTRPYRAASSCRRASSRSSMDGDRSATVDLLEPEYQRHARRAQEDQETERVHVSPQAGLFQHPAVQKSIGLQLGDDRIGVARHRPRPSSARIAEPAGRRA